MQVTQGPTSHQVLQRNERGVASLSISGSSSGERVEANLSGGAAARRLSATVMNGAWAIELADLPVGGPYTIQLSDGGAELSISDLFVGDNWALAGQSNMEGVGDLVDVESPSVGVNVLDLADHWRPAIEPLHWLFESVDSAHWPCDAALREYMAIDQRKSRLKGAGLGLAFGKALQESLNIPVGLIVSARGGTSMQQWSPGLTGPEGSTLYSSLVRRIRKAGGVRGVLWYQGESDANPADCRDFPDRFRLLVDSLRDDLGHSLPFLYVQLGRFVAPGTLADIRSWNSIQEAQRKAAASIRDSACVAAVDLELDDAIHVGTDGLRRLGRRLARAAEATTYGNQGLLSGPQLHSVILAGDQRDRVEIEYTGANGGLRCDGRLSGFSFRDMDGHHVPIIFRQTVDKMNANKVVLWLTAPLQRSYALHYGWGRDPYCNLVDCCDMAAPVFGPIHLS